MNNDEIMKYIEDIDKRHENEIKFDELINKTKEQIYRKEIERLHSIIKEAREYVKICKDNDIGIRYQKIEEILGKGSGKEC